MPSAFLLLLPGSIKRRMATHALPLPKLPARTRFSIAGAIY